jgi:serine/threonine-protein kinase
VVGLAFGKYQLYERLAEGGMAVVWRAKLHGPSGFEKQLVVKQIRPELAARPEFVELFVAEAKLTVSLTHANIVPVYELGMVDGTYFLALELVDGPPLVEVIEKGPVSPFVAAYIVEQVLRGLDYAHRRGVVHRDLSSANVLVSRDGEVKIVDFGIAAAVDARAVRGGSRGYVAPEQEAGARPEPRSDLYAVGVLLWELTAGRRYDGGAPDALPPLATIITRATAPEPEARFADAASMLAAIARFLRDVSYVPNQLELSSLVRRRCPDTRPFAAGTGVPRAAADEHDQPERPDGPRTAPMPGRGAKQVTFATRIATGPGRRWPARSIALAAVVLLALAGAAVTGVRQFAAARKTEPVGRANGNASGNANGIANGNANGIANGNANGIANENASATTNGAGAAQPVAVHRPARPRGRGQLTLNALPWAHVTIDGEKVADTPLYKLPIAAGPHAVKLQSPPTGREFKLTVTIEPDQEVRRVVDMRGEPHLTD